MKSSRANERFKQRVNEMDMGQVITIDGPAASGKTSVSRELAKRMGWHWVSTGAFYRGLAYAALRLSVDLTSEHDLAELSKGNKWRVEMDEERTRVYFENEDVTDQIAQEAVGNVASKISHFPKVRESLLQGQRRCQDITAGLIAEGRDCGTVVFPDAAIKIYLTARSENRAERRAKEQGLSAEALIEAQTQRDLQDSTRKAAPLQVPANALLVDTTELDFDQVVALVESHVKKTTSIASH